MNADLIGLSGLITPSLDEMVHVASLMEREGMTTPLLIGGATTRHAIHTAVKIEPAYLRRPVHPRRGRVARAVAVAGSLLDKDGRGAYPPPGSARSTRSSASTADQPARPGRRA